MVKKLIFLFAIIIITGCRGIMNQPQNINETTFDIIIDNENKKDDEQYDEKDMSDEEIIGEIDKENKKDDEQYDEKDMSDEEIIGEIDKENENNLSDENILFRQNVVVKNPKMNQVTNEISKKLIGKYIAEGDTEMYFEIKPNGEMEFSYNGYMGCLQYTGQNIQHISNMGTSTIHTGRSIQLTTYYSDTSVMLSFSLIHGLSFCYPGLYLSLDFEGDSDCTYFETMFPKEQFDRRMKFVKQEIDNSTANEQIIDNLIPDEQDFNNIVMRKNVIVQNPQSALITNEISEKLLGKYIIKDDPETYFEIKSDGKIELSLKTNEGYVKYDENDVQLLTFYNSFDNQDIRIMLDFRLVFGYRGIFPSNHLSLNFVGEPDGFSFNTNWSWSRSELTFVKEN